MPSRGRLGVPRRGRSARIGAHDLVITALKPVADREDLTPCVAPHEREQDRCPERSHPEREYQLRLRDDVDQPDLASGSGDARGMGAIDCADASIIVWSLAMNPLSPGPTHNG